MVDFRGSAKGAFHLGPQDAQRLRQACPDLQDWSQSWHVEPADIAVGQQLVELLTPFMLHLLDQGLAKATVSRHRDNLCPTVTVQATRHLRPLESAASEEVRDRWKRHGGKG